MAEKEKMIEGKIYDPSDKELVALRTKAHRLSKEYAKPITIGNNCWIAGSVRGERPTKQQLLPIVTFAQFSCWIYLDIRGRLR